MSRLVVFGAGSIGAMTAAYLERAGTPVTLIDPWPLNVETIRRAGIAVERTGEAFTARPRALHVDEIGRLEGPIDVLVVAMKAYDTEWVARLCLPYLGPDAAVVSAQNGMNEDRIASIVGRERVVGCAVPMSAFLDRAGHVVGYTAPAAGAFVIGELDGAVSARVAELADLLAPAGRIRTSDRIVAEIWAKLLVNVTTNALGGITHMTTPELWGDRTMVTIMVALGGEAVRVARALGQAIADIAPPGLPADMRYTAEDLEAAHAGDAGAFEVIVRCLAATAAARRAVIEGKVSLLQDLIRGRRTEVDHLNGWVAAQGRAVGVDCPANAAITEVVHGVELGKIAPGRPTALTLLEPATGLAERHI